MIQNSKSNHLSALDVTTQSCYLYERLIYVFGASLMLRLRVSAPFFLIMSIKLPGWQESTILCQSLSNTTTLIPVQQRNRSIHYPTTKSGLSGPKCLSNTIGSVLEGFVIFTPSLAACSLTKYSSWLSWPYLISAGVSMSHAPIVP